MTVDLERSSFSAAEAEGEAAPEGSFDGHRWTRFLKVEVKRFVGNEPVLDQVARCFPPHLYDAAARGKRKSTRGVRQRSDVEFQAIMVPPEIETGVKAEYVS